MALFPKDSGGRPLSQYAPDFYSAFLSLNIEAGKPVYIQHSEDSLLLSDFIRPDPELVFMGRIEPDPETGAAAFLEGEFDLLAYKLLAYIEPLGPDSDPPLAAKAPASLYDVIRPVAGQLSDRGHWDVAERLISGFFKSFTGPDGRLMLPYDGALNAQAFLTQTLYRLKRYPEAAAAAERLIELNPTIGYSYYVLALARMGEGRDDEAFESAAEAARRDRVEPSIALLYSRLLAKERSIAEATIFLTERAAALRRDGLSKPALTLEEMAACLALPPEMEDLQPSEGEARPSGALGERP
jgi:tetratricopeptide (TPR) repeat protein